MCNFTLLSSNQELIEKLKNIDISVPLRTDGRKTAHTEIWSCSRLLSTLSQYDEIYFPFTSLHRDKPDFLFNFDNLKIGLEVTESIPVQYAKFCALAENEYPCIAFDFGHFRWNAERLNKSEMRKILANPKIVSAGWSGDSAEREWALFFNQSIRKKLEKLKKDEFVKFSQNWLLIYDNLPIPNVNLGIAVKFLRDLLIDCWESKPAFDAIFVEHGPVIVKITAHMSVHLALNDIWE